MNFDELDYKISRSHKFWGRKPVSILSNIFHGLNSEDVFVDPFCGSGASVLAALSRGARVIASDVNPMSLFLTKVLVNPVNIPILIQKFEDIKFKIKESILATYKISCPKCSEDACIDFLVWNDEKPTHAKIKCPNCHKTSYIELNNVIINEHLDIIKYTKPDYWYPKTEISGIRKPKEKYHYELFTSRNLANLSQLIYEINSIEPLIYREALQYIFSAMLYSVSKMQMFSEKDPNSSRGWTALRYYVPPLRKEKNVWLTFEARFNNFIKLKEDLNKLMPDVRISDRKSYFEFLHSEDKDNLLLFKADILKETYKVPEESTFVFLDPPYKDDIDYKSLFEFSGVWFNMEFKDGNSKLFQRENIDSYFKIINKILESINKRTESETKVLLAFGSVTSDVQKRIDKIFGDNNFKIDTGESGQFFYGIKNSIIKSAGSDKYFFLTRKNFSASVIKNQNKNEKLIESKIINYLKLRQYLGSKKYLSIDSLINKTFVILPKSIKNAFTNYTDNIISAEFFKNNLSDTKSYNTFCFNILNCLIVYLGLEICFINEKYFDNTFLSFKGSKRTNPIKDKRIINNCAFILKYKSTNLIFSFGHQDKKILQNLSNYIYKIDSNKYRNIHIIIFKKFEELNDARKVSNVNVYKRSFFTSFDRICTKVKEIDRESYENIFSIKWDFGKSIHKHKNIISLHNIVILDNVHVGLTDSKLYKLTFKTKATFDILPGQFIMIDTLKDRQKEISKEYRPKVVNSFSYVNPNINNDLRTKQISYLKRPFGIYRTYYENFDYDYLSKLNLDKTLATILYTVRPNKFEILYKVLDGGIGTNELTKIAKDDEIEILAPLGKVFDLRELLKEDFDEIHIIGGGVGIAPLVYMVQALRYFNIKVKAFIGIENTNTLTYKDLNSKSFTGSGRNAKIYIDDLKSLGLSGDSDIYLSIQSNTNKEIKIDLKNVFINTMITEPYAVYLKNHGKLRILTFTCGPIPMMQKVNKITQQYNIKSYVLMEKRMACGTGVCFSCVCKTKVNDENHYSRVCIDGPIIESKIINWDEQQP